MKDRYQILLDAIEFERKEEELFFKSMNASTPIKQRVAAGFAWYPVDVLSTRYTVGEYLEIEISRKPGDSGSHKMKEGAGVNLFFNVGSDKTEFGGIISFVRKEKMRVILRNDAIDKDDIPEKGLAGVELVYDARPYIIMHKTINTVRDSKDEYIKILREGIRNTSLLLNKGGEEIEVNVDQLPPYLNPSQKTAIRACIGVESIGIIHGPPGTGKTTTLTALVKALSKTEKRILVCAPSNNAVDLLAERISELQIDTIRIGNITRIGDKVMHLTLEDKLKNHGDWSHIKKVKIQADEAEKMSSKYRRSFGQVEREERFAYKKEARELRKWARELEYKLTREIVGNAKVVVSTLIGAAHPDIDDLYFDTVIIDEASQALEPESWVAMIKGKRTILAGDHKQLPPTVKSRNAAQLGLETTLLDILTLVIHDSYLLNTQYRMNDTILGFSNQMFYNGKLLSSEKVANRLLRSLAPLTLIDTSGTGFEEVIGQENRSYKNDGEFFLMREHILANKENLLGASIGVISPYAEQIRNLRISFEEETDFRNIDFEIDTIDGFQGQEKDVIYISLVRSNDKGEIGFLADERRLNVALTRARFALIVIGDGSTLSNHGIFSKFWDYAEENKALESAWSYMSG
ncbi:MAG TPA: IGHMBP2 family helicase [Saprospiraceae bacterium]|nr:IGHMBP2 family helicase [Saprospiraceae bacterium]